MVVAVIEEYLPPLLMIMGLMEYAKKFMPNRKKEFYMVVQAVVCFIAGVLLVAQTWQEGFITKQILSMIFKGGLLLALSTLFYDLLLKKIKAIGNGKKE